MTEMTENTYSENILTGVAKTAGTPGAADKADRRFEAAVAADSLPAGTYTLNLQNSAGRLALRPLTGIGGGRGRWLRVLVLLCVMALAGLGVFLSISGSPVTAEELPFRLHIIANSDNAADQTLKLQVRDAVVEYLTPLLAGVQTRAEARQIVEGELAALQGLAQGICREYGYGAVAEVGTFDFPPKRYGATVLPEGEYQALRIVLGDGAGHNWWCVLFPPLCFVDECGGAVAADAGDIADNADGSLRQGQRVVRLKMAEIFDRAG